MRVQAFSVVCASYASEGVDVRVIRNPAVAHEAAGSCAAQPENICPLVVLLLINQDAATLATRIEAHMVGKLSFALVHLYSPRFSRWIRTGLIRTADKGFTFRITCWLVLTSDGAKAARALKP